MRRLIHLAIVLSTLSAGLLAQPVEQSAKDAALVSVASTIQVELESHGDRVHGKELYHWSTRLEKAEGCHIEFSERLTDNYAEPTVRVKDVSFSLGALDPKAVAMQNHFLQLACDDDNQDCIFSTSTCTHTSAQGIVTDCSSPNQSYADGFALQVDGDEASSERLEQAFRKAVLACQQPTRVSY